MKKKQLGLILAVLMMFPFVMKASAEEASASTSDKAIEEAKPAEAPTTNRAADVHFGQSGTGQTFGQGRDQHLRLCGRRLLS